jgi:hypothetical protein
MSAVSPLYNRWHSKRYVLLLLWSISENKADDVTNTAASATEQI